MEENDNNINETISERIHDAEPDMNEKMVHWLHDFLIGEISIDELKETFEKAYEKQIWINYPWC